MILKENEFIRYSEDGQRTAIIASFYAILKNSVNFEVEYESHFAYAVKTLAVKRSVNGSL